MAMSITFMLWQGSLCVCAFACVCVCMLHKSGFLGNTDFNFKSFPGTLFKGKQLINCVGKIPRQIVDEQRAVLAPKFAASAALQPYLNNVAEAFFNLCTVNTLRFVLSIIKCPCNLSSFLCVLYENCDCVSDFFPQLEKATQFQIYFELSSSLLPLRAGWT